jgi:hypothetical protein
MHRAGARFPIHQRAFHYRQSPPALPKHVGQPLTINEQCLLRRPNEWFDMKVQLRAIDDDVALVLCRDQLERVQLSWLRR